MPPTKGVLCCFDCTHHSLLPGQEYESCTLHLKSQICFLHPTAAGALAPKRGLCNHPLPLQQTQSSKPGRAAVLHTVGQALLCTSATKTLLFLGCARCFRIPRCERWGFKCKSAHMLPVKSSDVYDKEKQRSPPQDQNLQCFKTSAGWGEKTVYPKAKGQDHFCALKFLTKIQGSPSCSEYVELPDSSHPSPATVQAFPASPLLPALGW